MLPITELDIRMKQIRQGYQHEGDVLYLLDNNGFVLGLLKKKTVWYIMCRAIREKLRVACEQSRLNALEKWAVSRGPHEHRDLCKSVYVAYSMFFNV